MTIVPETRASISPVDFLRAAKHTPAVEGNTQRLLLLDTARIVLLPRAYADVPFSPLDHPGTWPPFENTLFACLDCQSKRGTRAGLASLVSTISEGRNSTEHPDSFRQVQHTLAVELGLETLPKGVIAFDPRGEEIIPKMRHTPEVAARLNAILFGASHIARCVHYMIFEGEDGRLVARVIGNTFLFADKDRQWLAEPLSVVSRGWEAKHIEGCLAVAFAAMDLLACKNVVLTDNEEQVSRQRKRHGYKGIQWKTIAIAGKSQVVKREGAPVNISEIMPLHECRGHFKEYSSSRPLFGKVSGKFFWHPHVRGRVTNGVVLHDKYEVKA